MKKIILLFCLVFLSSASFAQLLVENFDYPIGDSLTQHNWVAFSGAGNALFATSPGLSFPSYIGSGVGGATTITLTTASSQDAYRSFSSDISSGSVYTSFMIRVDTAALVGTYFVSYLPSTNTTNYYGRVYAKEASNGNIAFGVSKGSNSGNPEVYSDSIYVKGTTYVIVLKYTFNAATTDDDEVSLFVFSAAIPSTEPAPNVGPITTTQSDINNIGRIAIRQGTGSGGAVNPGAVLDGFRVTRSWKPSIWNFTLGIQGLYNGGTLNISDTTNIYVRNNTSPYAVVDSAVSIINSASLSGSYAFDYASDGTYYFEIKYRNSPIYRNGITTWSKAGGESLTRSGGSYDFTTSAAQAFGSNQILIGSDFNTYNGDVNQDGVIDVSDAGAVDNDIFNFASGYLNTDLTGDDVVDVSDATIVDNNGYNFVAVITP